MLLWLKIFKNNVDLKSCQITESIAGQNIDLLS